MGHLPCSFQQIDSILTIWIASTDQYHRHSGAMRKHRTRNLEIPRCAIAHLRSGPSDHPGMTCKTTNVEEVPMKLHGYFRSSASYRVRIALNLKGLTAEHLPHHLRKGEQCAPAYLAINPQGLVPALEDDQGSVLTQSLAIIEWLDETHPNPPLLPKDSLERAKVRAFALAIAC